MGSDIKCSGFSWKCTLAALCCTNRERISFTELIWLTKILVTTEHIFSMPRSKRSPQLILVWGCPSLCPSAVISQDNLREFLQVWHKCSLGLEDELIRNSQFFFFKFLFLIQKQEILYIHICVCGFEQTKQFDRTNTEYLPLQKQHYT